MSKIVGLLYEDKHRISLQRSEREFPHETCKQNMNIENVIIMNRRGKRVLRKESFGGIFADTLTGRKSLLRPEEYEAKKLELLDSRQDGELVTLFNATERGYSLLQEAASSPASLFFEVTKKCNMDCTHCFVDANTQQDAGEISFSEAEPIIRQFSGIGGFYIRLTGGEPTTRGDFFDIVDLINDEHLYIGLNTNGLLNETTLDRILSSGIRDIRISLDGPEEINDRIRGRGTYRKVLQTLEIISAYNRVSEDPADVTINVVLMKSNKDYMEKMADLTASFGFNISFGLLRLTGRARREEMLSPEEVVQSAYTAQGIRKKFGFPRYSVRVNYDIFCDGDVFTKHGCGSYRPFPFDNSRCPLGTSGITLDAFGNIFPCGYMVNIERWKGEDARGKDLLELWYSSGVLNEVRQTKRLGCSGCEYHKTKCDGGCPVMAYAFENDISGKDPYCVRHVDISDALVHLA